MYSDVVFREFDVRDISGLQSSYPGLQLSNHSNDNSQFISLTWALKVTAHSKDSVESWNEIICSLEFASGLESTCPVQFSKFSWPERSKMCTITFINYSMLDSVCFELKMFNICC